MHKSKNFLFQISSHSNSPSNYCNSSFKCHPSQSTILGHKEIYNQLFGHYTNSLQQILIFPSFLIVSDISKD
jgi:hypothetical protein